VLSHGRACPRGLVAWSARRPVGPDVMGACLRKGQLFKGGWILGSNGGSAFITS